MTVEWEQHLHKIPEHLQAGMRRYLEHGIMPGSGLTRILQNDSVIEVVAGCDDDTLAGLRAIIKFLYNHCPANSYGSYSTVLQWAADRQSNRKASK